MPVIPLSYHMVIVNAIASIIVLGGVLFYRYIYPKKKINFFILLLIISILPITSVFRFGDYQSGDFNIQIYRMFSFYSSLKEGVLIPSWAGELNATYGNPLFLFDYTLPYYIICAMHFLGMSFIDATKIYLGLTLYLSGIFMYFFAKSITNNKLAAFASAIFYVFAPYHLIDVHFRATFGESTIFTLAPLLFLFVYKYSKEKKTVYLAIVALLTFLLFLAHPLLAGVFIGICSVYIAYNEFLNKDLRAFLIQLSALILGVLISAYIWAPFIIYSHIMYHFPAVSQIGYYPFVELFYSPWRLGFLFQGPKGQLEQIIGYTQLFVVLVMAALVVYKKIPKSINKQVIFWLTVFFVTLFLMNPVSNFIWVHVQFIGSMLVTYGRLSLVLAFTTSILAGYLVLYFKKKTSLVYLLIFITIGYTILNWGQRTMIPQITDAVLKANVPYSTLTEGPSYFVDTKWANPVTHWFSKIPQQNLIILNGIGTIRNLQRTNIEHIYQVSADTPLKVIENTLYFPGWKVTSNGKPVYSTHGPDGLITFSLSKGSQKIAVKYDDIQPEKALKIFGVIDIIALLLYISLYYMGKTKILVKSPKH